MGAPFLLGKQLFLRRIEPADVDGPYLAWVNDYEVTRYLETGTYPTSRDELARYVEATLKNAAVVFLAIVDAASGRHVGNVKLGPIEWLHRRASLGILLGDPAFRGRGYGTEATALMVEYGFQRLHLHKITLGVYADHEPAVRLYKKLGFQVEGTLKEHLFRDGAWRDKLVMGIRRAEFEERSGAATPA